MKENEKPKPVVKISENISEIPSEIREETTGKDKIKALKKPLIFVLMGIVFIGCMYLIFNNSSDKEKIQSGLNVLVPQPEEHELQADKQKAYEQEMLEEKMNKERNALNSLSDYWNKNNDENQNISIPEKDNEETDVFNNSSGQVSNSALNSYRNAQNTLSSFYRDEDSQTTQLQKQVEELKERLAEKEVPKATTVDDQLELMEKSYQMAAKYLPGNKAEDSGNLDSVKTEGNPEENFVTFTSLRKNPVSSLYRTPSNGEFADTRYETRNRDFYTVGVLTDSRRAKNSIRAEVVETQVVTGESGVRLRLLETAKTPVFNIPAGTILMANAKFTSGRLQLKINSIETEGNILAVDISVYDLDGQPGLYAPFSPEQSALNQMVGSMGNTAGTNISLSSTTGQQIASDLSKSVVQGVSGYFSKKVKTPKVTLKSGLQVLLVSKAKS